MSKRADLLAIAILSGILARWVAKHTFDESGNILGRKEGFDGSGMVLDYAKLAAAYSVNNARIDGAIGYLRKRGFIVAEKRDGAIVAKPLIDNLQKLYDGFGVVSGDNQGTHPLSLPTEKQNGRVSQPFGNTPNGDGQSTGFHHNLSQERNDTLFGHQSSTSSGKTLKAEFTWFRDHFISKFRIFRGMNYTFQGGRDAKAIASLLKHFGICNASTLTQAKVAEIDHFMQFYLTEPDREYFTGGYSLHGMWDNCAALQMRITKQPVKPKIGSHHFNADGSNKRCISWE